MQSDLTPKIDLRNCDTVTCENCGGIYFREVMILKRVPALMTGSREDTNVPFAVTKCDSCGHVNKGHNPFEESPKPLLDEEPNHD
jgi:uncharacterized Zn finger protein